jgi:NTP pyrophosphatase (non-canonical NTP hydrolase)
MPMACKGLAKLAEELGELQQVVGKKLAYYHGTHPHPDGTDLNTRLVEEMGDVLASIYFVARRWNLDVGAIHERATVKGAKFKEWHEQPDNNKRGVDRSPDGIDYGSQASGMSRISSAED